MITLAEIAVYAVILSGGNTGLTCYGHEHERVTCTNGLEATITEGGNVSFSNGVIVNRNKGFPTFSDGTHSWLNSAGWVAFSTGVYVRHISADYYKFSTGIECKTELPTVVACEDVPQAHQHWP